MYSKYILLFIVIPCKKWKWSKFGGWNGRVWCSYVKNWT